MKEPISDVGNKIKKVIKEGFRPNIDMEKLTSETSLIGKGLELDSANVLELVVSLEEEFNIVFDDSDLSIEVFGTIGSLTNFVSKKLTTK